MVSTSAAKRYHHGDLPRALVETARTLVEETGPANLTLRAVAAQVGVSPAALYRHFANLEALLAAVAAGAFDELTDVIESRDRGDPRAALHAVLTEYARFALRSPQLYRLMFGAAGPARAEHAELIAAQDRLGAVAAQALHRAAAAGAIADQDLDDVLLALRSLMHGVVMWALDAGLPADRALAGVEGVLAVMDRGLLPRPG
jgi:AcrR family transcriptional regulator